MKTYSERIKARATVHDPKITRFEDKVQAHYIASNAGVPVPELYQISDKADDIDFTKLPLSFTIKVNHWAACGGCLVLDKIGEDSYKDRIKGGVWNQAQIRALMNEYLAKEFTYELSQKFINRKVMVEEALTNEADDGSLPVDYKCFLFGGKVHYIQVMRDRTSGKITCDFMTPAWEKVEQQIVSDAFFNYGTDVPARPNCLDEIVEYAEILGKLYGEHVRVDMYATPAGAVFGEYTAQPASGDFFTDYGNKHLAELWDITEGYEVCDNADAGKKCCIMTVVDKYYEHYIPWFIHSAKLAYPKYDVIVFFRGVLNDVSRKMCSAPGATVVENYCTDYPYQAKTTACLRYTVAQDIYRFFNMDKYDYVHINDVDMLITREAPRLFEYHIQRMNASGWCYSNTSGTETGQFIGEAKRMPALITVSREWFTKTEKARAYYAELLKAGEVGLMEPYDEVMLYRLTKRAGLPLPTKETHPYRADYHGIHIGLFDPKLRTKYPTEQTWNNFLQSRITRESVAEYYRMMQNENFIAARDLAAGNEYSRELIRDMELYLGCYDNTQEPVKAAPVGTIALNVIVGANEGYELNRLLSPIHAAGIFDEIVIGVNTTDADVLHIADEYGTKVIKFQWCDNFAYARNLVLDATTSDFVMWLDADDVLTEEVISSFNNLKTVVLREQLDAYFIPYRLEFDKDGVCTKTAARERIFKRIPELRWQHPIHERVTYDETKKRHGFLTKSYVEHRPTKIGTSGVQRNIRIIRHHLNTYPTCAHLLHYLGRDLMLDGALDESYDVLTGLLKHKNMNRELLAGSLTDLGYQFAFNTIPADNVRAKKCAETAYNIVKDKGNSELFVLIGHLHESDGSVETAEQFYGKALQAKKPMYAACIEKCYYEVPIVRLALLFASKDDYAAALFYTTKALEYLPEDKTLQDINIKCREYYAGELCQTRQ